jgi:predicted enzyme related to lactoylglutathione lyase
MDVTSGFTTSGDESPGRAPSEAYVLCDSGAGAPARKGGRMGQPVVHFEVIGRDGPGLQRYYSDLFGWQIDANNPMNYGLVQRDGNTAPDGTGIGGGVAAGPEGYAGHVMFYVGVPDVEAALARAEELGGTRVMGPDKVMEGVVIGHFTDPEGHLVGVASDRG